MQALCSIYPIRSSLYLEKKEFKPVGLIKYMLIVLALLDIIGGIALALSIKGIFALVIGSLIIIKGFFSVTGGLLSKYFFDWMGWIDLITGFALLSGMNISWLCVLPILKGVYSIATSR